MYSETKRLFPFLGLKWLSFTIVRRKASNFYRTRVRSLAMLVTHWLTHSLTNSLPCSKLDRCDPGMWNGNSKLVGTVWLYLSLTDWLTHSLTDSCLVDLMALNDTNCLMFSQQLLKAVKRLKQVVGNISESKLLVCWQDTNQYPNPCRIRALLMS